MTTTQMNDITDHPKLDSREDTLSGEKVEKSISIRRPVEELYRCWRNLENLPHIMNNLESVTVEEDGVSHWVAKSIGDMTMEWDAQIVEERENELIAWRSVEGSEVINEGSVQFRSISEEKGVELKVTFRYAPPGGRAGVVLAKLFGKDAGSEIEDDLRRFKQLMETGEIASVTGQSSAREPRVTEVQL